MFLVDTNREIQLQVLGTKNFPWELEWSCQSAVNLSFLQQQKCNSIKSTNNFSLSLSEREIVNRSSDPLDLCWTRTPQYKMRDFCKLGVSRSVRCNVSWPRHCQAVFYKFLSGQNPIESNPNVITWAPCQLYLICFKAWALEIITKRIKGNSNGSLNP